MKHVVLKILANNLRRRESHLNNGINVNKDVLLTKEDIDFFVSRLQDTMARFYNAMKTIYLPAAGFIYGGDLYKWETELADGGKEFRLWVYVNFEDTNNIGHTAFMRLINKTGLLNPDNANAIIYKNYS
jgi:hypothetical protein